MGQELLDNAGDDDVIAGEEVVHHVCHGLVGQIKPVVCVQSLGREVERDACLSLFLHTSKWSGFTTYWIVLPKLLLSPWVCLDVVVGGGVDPGQLAEDQFVLLSLQTWTETERDQSAACPQTNGGMY